MGSEERGFRMSKHSCLEFLVIACFAAALNAQKAGPVAKWSFNETTGPVTVESVSGSGDKIDGYYKYVPGVIGTGLRFDGYTTSLDCPIAHAPQLHGAFTVGAWVALNTYPWNWVPIVDAEKEREEGFSLEIDAFGHVGLGASVDGQWHELVSTATLPLKRWAYIAGTFDSAGDVGLMTIYINGKPVGKLAVQGELTSARTNILIGRVRQATMPFPEGAIHPTYPVWYSLDGILDEVEIYDRRLSDKELADTYVAVKAPDGEVLPWQKMPSGPTGEGRFGAYFTTLHYQDTWDRMRRTGPDSDVVVRFDLAPIRLVFWQGTNYVPAWVTENDKWYTDEFVETWGKGCPLGGDCEPMSDKQERYSHVSVVESNNARVVVHWRYALPEVEEYKIAWPDPYTGWGDWVDEYWTVYPDGIAVRKQVLHSSVVDLPHEWQESIVLNQPGSKPEDDIHWDAVTLENMQGESKTYRWNPKPAGRFTKPDGPAGVTGPPDPNIQMINLKSAWKPFQIVATDEAHADIYGGENSYFSFECWNHWPVAQIASSGRPCIAADRASHTSLSHLYWKDFSQSENTETKLLMDGLTTKSPKELIPLAKSWLSPPTMTVEGEGYRSEGYDPTQRAFVVDKTEEKATNALKLTFGSSATSPVDDPAIVIKNWGESGAQLVIDGKQVEWGKIDRMGHIHRLQGTDLVVWMQLQTNTPLHIELTPTIHRSSLGR
jgi:Concanavalin A-like lectin/glucanases superfamily